MMWSSSSAFAFVVSWLLVLAHFGHVVQSKRFDRCQLARELIKQKIPRCHVPTYMCIAEGESNYDTAAINRHNWDGSSDHGIFQINDRYWCKSSNDGHGSNGCKIDCDALRDNDISDDVKCALHIHRVHGLHAWVVYNKKCVGRHLSHYVAGCNL